MELAHSFNIILDSVISDVIKDVQKTICSEVDEQRCYDNSPHLAVATKFITADKTDDFIEALVSEFCNQKPFDIAFTKFEASSTGNYIFLNLDQPSREKIFELSRRAFNATVGIGNEGQGGNPPKYPFDPHVSVIKLNPNDMKKALTLVNKKTVNFCMTVTNFEITRELSDGSGYSKFPVVATISCSI